MIVRTEKLTDKPICENACSFCNGVGRTRTVPYGNYEAWVETCSHCFGEKVFSVDLQERKSKGEDLTLLIREKYKTMRELSEIFGGSILEWSNAKTGRATIEAIVEKIKLVETLPDYIRPEPKPYERPKLKTNGEA